ncbi:hypothetical protein BpHYR1_040502 [Brachionus plicatilis]|uniref:Uncharacterized protein n=1 Tax=Brachionus plicatilis TaxID=10195 RepID=A0A3M7QGG4_BRAPC|nr:hypothetical protein BpHYR1_040502 [Brachionus plicatilis]
MINSLDYPCIEFIPWLCHTLGITSLYKYNILKTKVHKNSFYAEIDKIAAKSYPKTKNQNVYYLLKQSQLFEISGIELVDNFRKIYF